jgi:thiamine kinase-like enzyme
MADLSAIVERLGQRLGAPAGPPVPLEGGITNRNYRVHFGEREYMVRLPGRDTGLLGINRAAERIAGDAAAALGIAPPVAAGDDDCLVTEFLRGGPVDPDQLRAAPQPVAVALRSFHDCGVRLPVRFWVPELLDSYALIVAEREGTLPDGYAQARELAERIAAVLPLSDPVPCHNDLLPSNLLRLDSPPRPIVLVDWEYAGMGHRLFDLGNLAVNNEFDDDAERRLLEAYFDQPPGPERRAQLRLMRIMSDAREAAWGVVQGSISELEFDFGAYAADHFARLARAASDPRLKEWLVAASA